MKVPLGNALMLVALVATGAAAWQLRLTSRLADAVDEFPPLALRNAHPSCIERPIDGCLLVRVIGNGIHDVRHGTGDLAADAGL